MRLVSLFFFAFALSSQQPIGVGPDRSAGSNPGIVNYFDWYYATPSGGCVNGAGTCVGHSPQGDFYYWSAWLPDASGLPVTSGLPIVGTINDYTALGCGGNLGLLQLDTWSWAAPSASHISKVNCMTSYGTTPGATNTPAGWNGHLTSSDSSNQGSWKSRVPFSKGGIIYLPVERQIPAGTAAVHDATLIMSPDSGKHWCNPYTWANRSGSPGCDSSNWQAAGDAPKCDAPDSSHPCTDAGYLDSTHSSIMWKTLPLGTEAWAWINFGNQDGQPFPTGIPLPFDPNTNTCFILMPQDGSVACVANASIMDISAWKYYTCPTMTDSYRCPASDPANWTSTFANRTSVFYSAYYGFTFDLLFMRPATVMYVKEFGSYLIPGRIAAWAPSPIGPWTNIYKSATGATAGMIAPATGYNVISTDPPHVQIGSVTNGAQGGQGSPIFVLWDVVLGKSNSGEAFQSESLYDYTSGAGYQFSDGHMPGSFPRNGLVWAFDFQDQGANSGITNWPYFVDRANRSAVIKPCIGGSYGNFSSLTECSGGMISYRGVTMEDSGIRVGQAGYGAAFTVFPHPLTGDVAGNAPAAMQGNGSYSVVGVFRLNGNTSFNRCGGLWATGTFTASTNTEIILCNTNGNLQLAWNSAYRPRSHYVSTFTFPNFTNWYFIAATVKATTTACTTNCVPVARLWIGGAVTPGVLTDTIAGVSWTDIGGSVTVHTPNVTAAPFVIGMGGTTDDDGGKISLATLMVYSRPLTYPEVQMMYQSMKMKMAARGVTLQ
jgi:hypothetical protein